MQISWKHTEVDLVDAKFNTKIDIFYEKVWGWTLYPADLMIVGGLSHDRTGEVKPIPESGFACLQVVFAYFEMIGRYVEGINEDRQSKEMFIRGFRFVFPEIDTMPYHTTTQFLRTFYSGGRCGLYHRSMTGRGIAIGGDPWPPIECDSNGQEIRINPWKLPKALIANLDDYCNRLRDLSETKLRENFEKLFDLDNGTKRSSRKTPTKRRRGSA